MTAVFIAVEGPNGVGKTTVAGLLTQRLGDRVHLTTEPTRTPLGTLLRGSESRIRGRALALAIAADRAAHIEDEIIPKLDAGYHVVTDRYLPSSLVLQRLDGLELSEIWSYNQYTLPPALTVYLEDTPDTIAARLAQRSSLSRLERIGSPARELQLYRDAAAFLDRQEWARHTIDCRGRTPDQVVADILSQPAVRPG